jgi:hypothetical protein
VVKSEFLPSNPEGCWDWWCVARVVVLLWFAVKHGC